MCWNYANISTYIAVAILRINTDNDKFGRRSFTSCSIVILPIIIRDFGNWLVPTTITGSRQAYSFPSENYIIFWLLPNPADRSEHATETSEFIKIGEFFWAAERLLASQGLFSKKFIY
jgi:hypothetical protein